MDLAEIQSTYRFGGKNVTQFNTTHPVPNIEVAIMHEAMKGEEGPIPLMPISAGSETLQIAAIDNAAATPHNRNRLTSSGSARPSSRRFLMLM